MVTLLGTLFEQHFMVEITSIKFLPNSDVLSGQMKSDIYINGRRSVNRRVATEFNFMLYLLHVCAVAAITVGNTNAEKNKFV